MSLLIVMGMVMCGIFGACADRWVAKAQVRFEREQHSWTQEHLSSARKAVESLSRRVGDAGSIMAKGGA